MEKGKWALKWDGIKIESMKVINSNSKFKENELSTHWAQSDIDLARGLDFYRTEARNGGPVLATFTHLNYDVFKYQIQVYYCFIAFDFAIVQTMLHLQILDYK